jgi:hypothetical protein
MATNQELYWLYEVFGTDPDTIGFFGNAGIVLPSGSTLERPTPPSEGHIRVNTDLNIFEGYVNGSWITLGSTGGGSTDFISLTDTPAVYTGAGNRVLKVGSTETGVEFAAGLEIENSGRIRVTTLNYNTLVTTDDILTNKKYVDDQDNLQLSLSGGTMTGILNTGGNQIVGLPAPTIGSHAANKSYVDGISAGLDPKESVRAATLVPGTLASDFANGDTIDGIVLVTGDRILIKNQASAIENGIYTVNAVGAPTRAADQDGSPAPEVSGGNFTFIETGTQASTGWVVVFNGILTVGFDAMNWTQFSEAGTGSFLPLAGGSMFGDIVMSLPGVQFAGASADTAATPTYSWTGDLDTGMFHSGADAIGFSTGSTERWNINAAGHFTPAATVLYDIGTPSSKARNVYADHFLPNFGAVGDPSYSFEGDTTTGMYRGAASQINFAVGGADALTIESDGTVRVIGVGASAGEFRINDDAGGEFVGITVPSVVTTSYTLTLPIAAGTAGQVLSTTGGGVLEFSTISTTSISDVDGDTNIQVEESGDEDIIRFDTGDTPAGFGISPNVLTIASSGIATGFAAATTASQIGATIDLTGGEGGLTSDGGAVTITGGDGGGASGVGGAVVLLGGMGSDGGDLGGDVNIDAGVSTGFNEGANVNVTAGAGAGPDSDGGNITISAGASTGGGGFGGTLFLNGGDSGGTGTGGNVSISAGGATDTNSGGDVLILAGSVSASTGDGGDIYMGVGGTTGGSVGQIIMGDGLLGGGGTAPEPILTFIGDQDTGFYRSGADTVNISAGGTRVAGFDSTGLTLDKDLVLLDDAGGEFVGISAPSAVSSSYTLTLPTAAGTVGQVLSTTDGIGTLAFTTISTTSISDVDGDTKIQVEEGGDDDTIRFDVGATPVGYGAVADIFTIAASGWNVAMGTADAATVGAPINLTAGTGATTGAGGTINLTGGNGGVSAGGDGGAVVITAGSAGAASAGDGGDIELRPGALDGAGADGTVRIIGPSAGAGELRLADDAGGEYVGIKAPSVVTSSYSLTLPTAVSTVAGAPIVSDTAGNLSYGTTASLSKFAQDNATTGISETFTHSLGTLDVVVQVYDLTVSPRVQMVVGVEVTSTSVVTITLFAPPASTGDYRVVIIA